MLQSVPIEFLRLIEQPVHIPYSNAPTQMPQFLLVVIPTCIGLNKGFGMEFLIELLKKHALLKSPTGGLADRIDIPTFCDNAILDDS